MHYLVYVDNRINLDDAFESLVDEKLDYFLIGGSWNGGFKLVEEFNKEQYDKDGIEYWEDDQGISEFCSNHAYVKDINLEYMLMPYAILTEDGIWLDDEDEINNYLDKIDEENVLTIVDIHN